MRVSLNSRDRQGHAETGKNVPHLEGGGQAVAGGIGDDDIEDIVIEHDDVVEVAADDLGGDAAGGDLKVPWFGEVARQDRVLDLSGFLHDGDHPLLAELLVDGETDDVEGSVEILVVIGGLVDIEGQDVLAVRDRDGGKPLAGAEFVLEAGVEAFVVAFHDHDAGLKHLLEGWIGLPDTPADRSVGRVTEALDQFIAAIRVDVDSTAGNAEVIREIRGQELRCVVDNVERSRAQGDGLEGAFDSVEQ